MTRWCEWHRVLLPSGNCVAGHHVSELPREHGLAGHRAYGPHRYMTHRQANHLRNIPIDQLLLMSSEQIIRRALSIPDPGLERAESATYEVWEGFPGNLERV
jgi:hypothetical protein